MILKKKGLFLLIFLIFLQSCSGGRIGNFLESSFNDLEKTSKIEDLENNLLDKNDINLEKENKEIDDKKNKKIKKVEKPKNVLENKKNTNLEKENKDIDVIKNKKIRVISKKNQVFSRIHVADIANAIIYLLQNKNSLKFYQIINIADDEPCSQIEVIQYCYDLLGLTMPKPILFEDAKEELSPIAQSFWMENRRVSNKLLCETLGYKLIYKNYKKGLKNCFLNI